MDKNADIHTCGHCGEVHPIGECKVKDKKPKYEILIGGQHWLTCKSAEEIKHPQSGTNGWLHYELADGTIGLKRPGTWRKKDAN